MLISVTHLLLLSLHAVTAQLDLPKCWVHYGECLDDNQPPLNIQDIVKPLPNDNVIKIEKDVETIEDCKNKCEDVSSCTYYTLYKNDLNKNCQIVGFNLGNACNYLSNVCVLLRSCKQFDNSCDRACVTGRRLIQDETKEYRTLLVGGVKAKRLSIVEHETSIEVLNQYGETQCLKDGKTSPREGAAGAFYNKPGGQLALLCGGWLTTDKDNSDVQKSYFVGEFYKSCEKMTAGNNWDKTNTIDMVNTRAFHSMVATDAGIFAFGGYNNYKGFLDSIEFYDPNAGSPAWVELTDKLTEPKSHTCAVVVKYDGEEFMMVIGGYTNKLEYSAKIELFKVAADGTLTVEAGFEMPADRVDAEDISKVKGDLGCMSYRRNNWEDGVLLTGGYRDAGAWINTAWWLSMERLRNSSITTNKWERLTNISPMFDGGRHNHQMSTAALSPLIIGGWRNKALDENLLFSECEEDDDPTRVGVWTQHSKRLKVGREKFIALSVPKEFVASTEYDC